MAKHTISKRVKSATKVNLSYGSSLFNLSKQYFNEISTALLDRAEDSAEASDVPLKSQQAENPAPLQPARPPLIVAGRHGETAHAAMVLSNTSNIAGTLTFQILGDFPGINILVEPPAIEIPPGESAIIRIMATMNAEIPAGVSYPGIVFIAEHQLKVAEFVLQRLPDLADKKPARRRRTNKTAARKTPTPSS